MTICGTHRQTISSGPDLKSLAVRERLNAHFLQWIGAIPRPGHPQLVITELRDAPGWDGKVRPIQGVAGPEGTVLAISPDYAGVFAGVDLVALFEDAGKSDGNARIERRLGMPVAAGMPIFRWSEATPVLPEPGQWVETDDPRIPDWLRPFNGGILVALDADERYMAGVGLKRHNDIAREISVGSESRHRGKGLATRLVAQAAREIIGGGGVPIYQHGGGNLASARAATSAGFPDRGWHMLEIHPGGGGQIRG